VQLIFQVSWFATSPPLRGSKWNDRGVNSVLVDVATGGFSPWGRLALCDLGGVLGGSLSHGTGTFSSHIAPFPFLCPTTY